MWKKFLLFVDRSDRVLDNDLRVDVDVDDVDELCDVCDDLRFSLNLGEVCDDLLVSVELGEVSDVDPEVFDNLGVLLNLGEVCDDLLVSVDLGVVVDAELWDDLLDLGKVVVDAELCDDVCDLGKVVDVDDDGGEVSFEDFVLRLISSFLSPFLFSGFRGFLSIARPWWKK